MKRGIFLCLIFLLLASPTNAYQDRVQPITCSYKVSKWNIELRRSVDVELIRHSYDSLTEEEVDMVTGCTVCSEDQVLIEIPPLEPFHICYKYVDRVRDAFEELVRSNAIILSIRGYKVIRSRGPLDDLGNRTRLSNHSYGTAIDINRELNGLYDNCIEFGPECRLLHGGNWDPDVPGTLVEGERIVETLKSIGFKWGGEIRGKQKDFMHFSFSGY